MLKVVQFKDGTYGLRKSHWFIPGTEYWDFSRTVWEDGYRGVIPSCRTDWETAENTRLFLEDAGEVV